MNPLLFWFKQHRISTHSIAVIVTTVFAAYHSFPEFQALVQQVIHAHPTLALFGANLAALYGWYRNGTKE